MHYVRHLAQMLEHCPPRYTGENTLCYRDGLLSKMTPASVLIYAKSTFESWQCAMNFTILFLSVAIVTFGNLALCLLIILSPPSCFVVGGGHDGAHDSNPGTDNCKDHMMVWVAKYQSTSIIWGLKIVRIPCILIFLVKIIQIYLVISVMLHYVVTLLEQWKGHFQF